MRLQLVCGGVVAVCGVAVCGWRCACVAMRAAECGAAWVAAPRRRLGRPLRLLGLLLDRARLPVGAPLDDEALDAVDRVVVVDPLREGEVLLRRLRGRAVRVTGRSFARAQPGPLAPPRSRPGTALPYREP